MANTQKQVNAIVINEKRQEVAAQLRDMPDRDLCELIAFHFESHPTLPGEKEMKDTVKAALNKAEWPLMQTVRDNLIDKYSETRIRQTRLHESNWHVNNYLQEDHGDSELFLQHVADVETDGGFVQVDKVAVSLEKQDDGRVNAYAEYVAWGNVTRAFVGSLPDSFLKNNPMNVEQCDADLVIADYSNGQRKTVSAQIVVDTDVMSGDAENLSLAEAIKDMNIGGPIDENDPDVIASRAADKVSLAELAKMGIDKRTISEVGAWMYCNPNYRPGKPPEGTAALYHYEQPVIYMDKAAAKADFELALPEAFTENERRWRNTYGACEFVGHENRKTWGIIKYDSYRPLTIGEHMKGLSAALDAQMDKNGMLRVGKMRLTSQELCKVMTLDDSNGLDKKATLTAEDVDADKQKEYDDFLKAVQALEQQGITAADKPEMDGMPF